MVGTKRTQYRPTLRTNLHQRLLDEYAFKTQIQLSNKTVRNIIDCIRKKVEYSLDPTIDCFPYQNVKYINYCTEYISGTSGFWSPNFDKSVFWKHRVAWICVSNLAEIKQVLHCIQQRNITGYCCLPIWKYKNTLWTDIKEIYFLKPYVATCEYFFVYTPKIICGDNYNLNILVLYFMRQ